MTQELWIVIGAGSAVGRAFARQAGEAGADVVLAARNAEDVQATAADIQLRSGACATPLNWEARAFDDHPAFVERCWEIAAGRRLNVFFAAGSMPDQEAAVADFDIARATVEVNYLSVVSMLTRFEPGLRKQRGGAFVVLGSVAGDRGRRKNFVYGSAKAGLHAFLQGMRSRLHDDGVKVVTIKPGFLDTAMTWGMPGLFLVAMPEAAARASYAAATKGRDEVYFPGFWRLVMAVIRAIPEPLFKRLSI